MGLAPEVLAPGHTVDSGDNVVLQVELTVGSTVESVQVVVVLVISTLVDVDRDKVVPVPIVPPVVPISDVEFPAGNGGVVVDAVPVLEGAEGGRNGETLIPVPGLVVVDRESEVLLGPDKLVEFDAGHSDELEVPGAEAEVLFV